MKNESQYGLLLLQRYLYEHTDDQHPASVADILAFWRECGIQAGRKSVYSASGKIRIVSPAAVLEQMRDMAAWLK